jgi:hypothetical protein
MKPLYQIVDSERPYICVRQAEAHELAQHLLLHPFWKRSVRPSLPEHFLTNKGAPPRDGIEESADTVYLPPGVPQHVLVGLQSIVDGWVTGRGEA